MSEQDVKVKVSSVAPKSESSIEKDIYTGTVKTSSVESKNEFGPGTSKYARGSEETARWRAKFSGSWLSAIPGANTEDVFSAVGEYCTQMNAELERMENAPDTSFNITPKIPFDFVRMIYETPDPTKAVDLKKNVPNIPSFSRMYKEVGDLEYVENYYTNRLGLINDLIKNTKNEIKTARDPRIIRARREFLAFLNERKTFIKNQMDIITRVAEGAKTKTEETS